MVSLQQPALSTEEKKASRPRLEDFLSKKRKRHDEEDDGQGHHWLVKDTKTAKAAEGRMPDIDLQLGAPLPLEWQQCLNIQSGEIHFYNTRTHRRTSKDPRTSTEPLPPGSGRPIGLDLELNLGCEPRRSAVGEEKEKEDKNGKPCDPKVDGAAAGGAPPFASPWMSLDTDRQEMVATVCMRCHMLVMMCKVTLSCPNCKFVHPPSHRSPSTPIKRTFNLLCCKDQ